MVWEDLKPRDILTPASFDNAIAVLMALGGSTNAIVHLVAMAGRAGIRLDLDRFDAISSKVPLLANLRPSGKYLMEDFYYAGGLRALLAELKEHLDLSQRNVNGKTLGENIARVEELQPRSHRSRGPAGPAQRRTGGAARQPRARRRSHQADCRRSEAAEHTGKAVVFDDYNDMAAASTTKRWMSMPPRSWCCATPVRSADPACRNGACSRSRRSCSSRACATWCAFPTRA